METAQTQLENASSELEKQRLLNERLENDLFSMGANDSNLNGDGMHTPAEDVLAGLDFAKKPAVSIASPYVIVLPWVHS